MLLAAMAGLAGVILAAPALADDGPKIDTGDTAWMLASTALVLLMTVPGLALFYAGMVRKKNVLATMMQSFSIAAVVSVVWTVIGYSLAFGGGNAYVGDLSRLFMAGFAEGWDKPFTLGSGASAVATTIPESVFFMFQMTFAIVTPALMQRSVE
jgi:Amt family ammonium transporter